MRKYTSCIRMLTTEIFPISVASTRERKCSGVQDGLWSDHSWPLPTLSVRAKRSFTIRYLNVVIEPRYGSLDICLSVADRNRKAKMLVWIALFGCAIEQFRRFRDRIPFWSQTTRARECTSYHCPSIAAMACVSTEKKVNVAYCRAICFKGYRYNRPPI